MLSTNLTCEQAYIVGFIVGDGNLSKTLYLVRMYDSDKKFANSFLNSTFYKAFRKMPNVIYDKHNNGYVVYAYSKRIWNFLREIGIPAGKKARSIEVPTRIRNGTIAVKSSYLAAFFDAEGSISSIVDKKRHPRGYIYFQLKTVNPILIDQTAQLLSDVVKTTPKVYHYDYGSILRINGPTQVKRILKSVGVKHPRFFHILA